MGCVSGYTAVGNTTVTCRASDGVMDATAFTCKERMKSVNAAAISPGRLVTTMSDQLPTDRLF